MYVSPLVRYDEGFRLLIEMRAIDLKTFAIITLLLFQI